jgi:hypothetical protein
VLRPNEPIGVPIAALTDARIEARLFAVRTDGCRHDRLYRVRSAARVTAEVWTTRIVPLCESLVTGHRTTRDVSCVRNVAKAELGGAP